MSGTEIPTKDDIEQKISDNDLSQEDVDQINKLSADKKGAKLLSEVFDKKDNRDKITQLINNDFISCSLDKQTVNIWYKFKNSINNPKVNKDGAFYGLIQTLEKKIGEFEGKINENDIKVTKETQEKLNKEQGQKELSTYLNIMPSKEDDINKMADGLFETNEARFNALFDEDFRKNTLTPTQQDNLIKYVQTYLHDKTITSDNIRFLTTTKNKVPDGDTTHRQSEKFPVGTNMIRLTTNTNAEIVFGTQDQAQSRISDAYIKEHPDKITELGDQIANIENKDITNEYIVNELNEKGSYVTLGKIIENKPETINKLLSNGFIESLMKSGENYKTKLDEANKKIREENLKDPNLKKPELTDTGLKSILDQQRDGYLNVINNAVLNIMKQPNITTSSPERTMFQSYMQSCNKDPRVLGATVDQRITSWNNIANRYKGFQDKNKVFFTDVISSSLPDLANRKNNTELSLHKAINNDFNALWIHIKGEGNEKYGLKAQMKSLFEGFKDEILMIAEFLGFDKEKIMHRCGFNKELKDEMTKFFKEKYELTGDQIKHIENLSINNKTLLENIKKVGKNGATGDTQVTPFASSKDAITAFRNSDDIRSTYLEGLKTVEPSGDFIKTLITEYNATQKNENDHINYLDYVTKVNKNGKDIFEPTGDKWKDLFGDKYGDKMRNLDFIWDNIAAASANLKAMTESDRNGKGSKSKTPEMADMVLEKVQDQYGTNTNEDMLVGISYYLGSMIIGGHDRLEYTISENDDKKPSIDNNKPADKVPETPKEKIIKDDKFATEKDGAYTITAEGAKKKIHDIIDASDKGPKMLVIIDKGGKESFAIKGKEGTTDTFVDNKTGKRTIVLEGYTIKEASQSQIDAYEGEGKVTATINTVKDWITKTDKNTTNYETAYTTNVTKPIFDLFTNKNTYDYMHQNDKEDATIKEAKTFDDLMIFSYNKFKPANSTTPFVHLDNIKEVIIKKKEESVNNKITFEVKTDLPTPRIFTIDVGGKFEEIKKDKTPEKNPTTVDYTSINTLRTSLGYVEKGKIPLNYTKKLMTELLKVDTTEDQQDMIIKEIVRTKLAEGNKIQDIATSQKGTKILDTIVYEPETGEFNTTCDIIKTGDKDIEINIENGKGKKFTIKTTIDDITKPVA